jgi:predicted solute-binding protein
MLLLTAFKRHLTPEIKAAVTISSMSTDLVVILNGIMSQLQVVDVVNKPFKNHLKQLYSEWLLIEDHALALVGRIKKPIVIALSQQIIMA